MDHLLNIRQTSNVDEYRGRFEELIVELPYVTSDLLESAFLKCLRKSLRDQMVRCRPTDLNDIVEIARLIESQERDNHSYQVRQQPRPPATSNLSPVAARVFDRVQSKRPQESINNSNRASGSGSRNTGDGWNHNRCRHYGDRWFPGHRCKQQRLKSLEITEEEEESPLIEELAEPLDDEEAEAEEG